jgi:predicted AlkP superfamily pyrophosphatase or phosphodiesterase
MAGHGGCLVSAHSTIMAMFDGATGGWVTNNDCYHLPSYVADDKAARVWESGESWLGHEIRDNSSLLRTGRFITYQVDALVSMIEREQVGQDEIPDLILANFKTLDYIGHRWGPDSDELAEALRDFDREFGRVIEALESVVGDNGSVIIIASDHGTPGEPEEPDQARYYITDIIEAVHDRFDPAERRVVLFYGDPADNQFFVDRLRLENLGFDLDSVATYLEGLPYIFSAYTEDEVAAVNGR